MPTASKSSTETVPATASSSGQGEVAKGATPEQVEEANKESAKVRAERAQKQAEAALAAAKGEGGGEDRQYVTDEDGISRLAAAKGQRVPEWAERMAEKTGGLSNEPEQGPESTARVSSPKSSAGKGDQRETTA